MSRSTISTPAPNSEPDPTRDRIRLFAAAAISSLMIVAVFTAMAVFSVGDPDADIPIVYHVNVNTAGADELQLLPGVGPALAQRIVDSREADGPFNSPDELSRVSGIGAKIVARMTPHIRFD